jgi:integrase
MGTVSLVLRAQAKAFCACTRKMNANGQRCQRSGGAGDAVETRTATRALAGGAELTTVRDNLRHASIATTSIYLHSDEVKRAQQLRLAFAGKP